MARQYILTVVTLPPVKCTLADQVIENEAEDKPQRVLGCEVSFEITKRSWRHTRIGRRNVTSRIEKDWDVDIANPAVRVAAVQEVDESGDHGLERQ